MELRRFVRAPLNQPVTFAVKGEDGASYEGTGKDISLGGMFVETGTPGAFHAEVTIRATLPGSNEPVTLPGIVRWTRPDGMGVQFQLLGARETYAITSIVRAYEDATG
jgi:type IV pilus assembly protein PilZ